MNVKNVWILKKDKCEGILEHISGSSLLSIGNKRDTSASRVYAVSMGVTQKAFVQFSGNHHHGYTRIIMIVIILLYAAGTDN